MQTYRIAVYTPYAFPAWTFHDIEAMSTRQAAQSAVDISFDACGETAASAIADPMGKAIYFVVSHVDGSVRRDKRGVVVGISA